MRGRFISCNKMASHYTTAGLKSLSSGIKRRSISLTEFEDKKFTGVKRVLMISANTLVIYIHYIIIILAKTSSFFRVGLWPIENMFFFVRYIA